MKISKFPPPIVGVLLYLVSFTANGQFNLCAGSAPGNVSGSYNCATGLANIVLNPTPALTGGCVWTPATLSSDPCQFVGSNIPAGNFNFSVLNNGVTTNYCVVVNPLLLPGIPNFVVINPSCLGNDGSITFNPAGFNVTLVAWSTGAFNTNTITGLVPGTYTAFVQILDPSGQQCTSIVPFTLPAYTPLTATATVVNDYCDADLGGAGVGFGTLSSTSTGGSGLAPIFQWTGPGTITPSNSPFTTITAGIGCFTVTVSDQLFPWCTASSTVQLSVGCDGDYDCNGVINIGDLLYFVAYYGTFSPTLGDIVGCDNVTNIFDFLAFNAAFGTFCP